MFCVISGFQINSILRSKKLMFYKILAQRGSSFCNRPLLTFQAFGLRAIRVAAKEDRVGGGGEGESHLKRDARRNF